MGPVGVARSTEVCSCRIIETLPASLTDNDLIAATGCHGDWAVKGRTTKRAAEFRVRVGAGGNSTAPATFALPSHPSTGTRGAGGKDRCGLDLFRSTAAGNH